MTAPSETTCTEHAATLVLTQVHDRSCPQLELAKDAPAKGKSFWHGPESDSCALSLIEGQGLVASRCYDRGPFNGGFYGEILDDPPQPIAEPTLALSNGLVDRSRHWVYDAWGGEHVVPRLTFWTKRGTWQSQTTLGRNAATFPGQGVLVARDVAVDGTVRVATQWFDEEGTATRPEQLWPDATSLGYFGVDAKGRALLTWRTAQGALKGQWFTRDDSKVGDVFDAPEGRTLSPLIRGGFLLDASAVLVPGGGIGPAPAWRVAHPGPVQIVGGAVYAVSATSFAEAASVSFIAPDGASCGTLDVLDGGEKRELGIQVGREGTVVRGAPSEVCSSEEQLYELWRQDWWPRLLNVAVP